jgi:hypothetical protein
MGERKPASAILTALNAATPSSWDEVWAAWCPACQEECIPLPSGRCGFCGMNLLGQPTRAYDEPPLTQEVVTAKSQAA